MTDIAPWFVVMLGVIVAVIVVLCVISDAK